jgi:hypothetical protein
VRPRNVRVLVAAAAATCVMAVGCGTARAPASSPATVTPAPAQTSAPRVATAAGNRAAALAEAVRLLALAQVPPGAVRVAAPPRSLPGPPLGTPLVSSLVDRVLAWQVRLPFTAVQAWLAAHPPRGLRTDGSSSAENTVTGQTTTSGISYRGPASPAWQSADLEISAAPAGPDATVIRADAVIVWLEPPVPSAPGPGSVRVTLAGGCPATDKNVTGVTNPAGQGLTRRLLPAGQPSGGLRCRYDGLNGDPWHLVAAQRLSAAAARQTASQMAGLPLSHPADAVVNCPMDDGSAEVLALAYRGRPDVDLWVVLNGCGGVSNGYLTAGGI